MENKYGTFTCHYCTFHRTSGDKGQQWRCVICVLLSREKIISILFIHYIYRKRYRWPDTIQPSSWYVDVYLINFDMLLLSISLWQAWLTFTLASWMMAFLLSAQIVMLSLKRTLTSTLLNVISVGVKHGFLTSPSELVPGHGSMPISWPSGQVCMVIALQNSSSNGSSERRDWFNTKLAMRKFST